MALISLHSQPLVKTDRTPVFIHNFFHSQFFFLPKPQQFLIHRIWDPNFYLYLFTRVWVEPRESFFSRSSFERGRRQKPTLLRQKKRHSRTIDTLLRREGVPRQEWKDLKTFKNHNSGGGDYKHSQIIMALSPLTDLRRPYANPKRMYLTTKKLKVSDLIVSVSSTWESFFFSSRQAIIPMKHLEFPGVVIRSLLGLGNFFFFLIPRLFQIFH